MRIRGWFFILQFQYYSNKQGWRVDNDDLILNLNQSIIHNQESESVLTMSARLQTPLAQPPREGWESMLLQGGSKEMWHEVLSRYKKGEEDLFRFRFDLKDVVAYSHQFYDPPKDFEVVKRTMQTSNKKLSKWIDKCGGRLKISLDGQVDLVIVEEDTLKDIIERFVKWRKSVLKEEAPSKVEKEKCNETEGIQNNKIVHKTKREQILLSQPYTSSKISFNSSQANLKQMCLPIQERTLNQSDSKMRLRSQNRLPQEKKVMQDLAKQIMAQLSKLSESQQRDFELLYKLFKAPSLMVVNIDVMYEAIAKYYMFTKEFFQKKKIQVDPNVFLNSNQINQLICFVSKENNHSRSGQQIFHFFDIMAQKKDENSAQTSQPVVLVPYFRKDAPLGSNAMLDHDEYIQVKKNSQRNIDRYKKSVAEMEMKKEEWYEINTPVPNSRHSYCNICRVLFQDYKTHIKSEEHSRTVKNDRLYDQIDDLIDQINTEAQKKEEEGKQLRDELTVTQEELTYKEEDAWNIQKWNSQSQEMTNQYNTMSTEITTSQARIPSLISLNIQKKPMFRVPKPAIANKQPCQPSQTWTDFSVGSKRKRAQKELEDLAIEKKFDYTKQLQQLQQVKQGQSEAQPKESKMRKGRFFDSAEQDYTHKNVIHKVLQQ